MINVSEIVEEIASSVGLVLDDAKREYLEKICYREYKRIEDLVKRGKQDYVMNVVYHFTKLEAVRLKEVSV